jgi:hypothetical protein
MTLILLIAALYITSEARVNLCEEYWVKSGVQVKRGKLENQFAIHDTLRFSTRVALLLQILPSTLKGSILMRWRLLPLWQKRQIDYPIHDNGLRLTAQLKGIGLLSLVTSVPLSIIVAILEQID